MKEPDQTLTPSIENPVPEEEFPLPLLNSDTTAVSLESLPVAETGSIPSDVGTGIGEMATTAKSDLVVENANEIAAAEGQPAILHDTMAMQINKGNGHRIDRKASSTRKRKRTAPEPPNDEFEAPPVQETSSKAVTDHPPAPDQNDSAAATHPFTLTPPRIAEYTTDTSSSVDHLGFSRYVEAFGRLLSAKETRMPLSIGFFGQWGTGKSSFMEQLSNRVESMVNGPLSTNDRWTVDRVAQIRFNAWHHMDCDLWASLADGIFTGLAAQFANGKNGDKENSIGIEQQRRKIVKKLESSRQGLDHARNRQRALLRKQTNIAVLQQGLDAVVKIRSLLSKSGAAEQTQLNDDDCLSQNNLKRLLKVASHEKEMQFFRRLGMLVGVYALVIVLLFCLPWVNNGLLKIAALGPALLTFLYPFFKYIHPIRKQFNRHQERIKTLIDYVPGDFNRILKEVCSVENSATSDDLACLVRSCRYQIEALDKDIAATNAAIAHIESGGLMYDFARQSSANPVYGDHRGLISTIRNDMERLKELIADYQTGGDNQQWRIILSIDDLDRCPAQRVVEVLQAIHLLLASDLFAVVVGVDPRWLESSLDRIYRESALHDTTIIGAVREFSARDYLEKIFQLPFVIPEMGIPGYARLVGSLISPEECSEPEHRSDRSTGERADTMEENVQRAPEQGFASIFDELLEEKETTMMNAVKTPSLEHGTGHDPINASARMESGISHLSQTGIPVEAIRLNQQEIDTINSLAPLFRTPRSVKRFINTYHLLRTTIPDDEFMHFLNNGHQGVIMLCAIVINYPQLNRILFKSITSMGNEGTGGPLYDAIKNLRYEITTIDSAAAQRQFDDAREQLLIKLRLLKPELSNIRLPIPWTREVGRYTFQ